MSLEPPSALNHASIHMQGIKNSVRDKSDHSLAGSQSGRGPPVENNTDKTSDGQRNPSDPAASEQELSLGLQDEQESSVSWNEEARQTPPPELGHSVEKLYMSYLSVSDLNPSSMTSTQPTSPEPTSPTSQQFRGWPFPDHSNAKACYSEPLEQETQDDMQYDVAERQKHQRIGCSLGKLAAASVRRFASSGYLEAPLPRNEAGRRVALQRYAYAQPMGSTIQMILQLGKMIFSAKDCVITMVDSDIVHCHFPTGESITASRGVAICAHVILVTNDEPMVVLDTFEDWRFRKNPAIQGDWDTRFYAGYPLRTEDGFNVGTLCVLDDKPRIVFTEHEKAELIHLANMVRHELQVARSKKEVDLCHAKHKLPVCRISIGRESLQKLVETLEEFFQLEGVLALELPTYADGEADRKGAKPVESNYTSPDEISILAASDYARQHPPVKLDTKALSSLLESHPAGIYHNGSNPKYDLLFSLSTSPIAAVAAFMTSRGSRQRQVVVCVYTTGPSHRFDLPSTRLSFLKDIGRAYCAIEARIALSLSGKAKENFIANISHELREPLQGALALCELLRDSSLVDRQQSLLETAQTCASSLSETINHIVDFTKETSQASNN